MRHDRRIMLLLSAALMSAASVVAPVRAESRRELWITNSQGNDVHIYDVADFKLLDRLEVGPNPHGISATDDGKTVHLAIEDFKSKTGKLLWLDAASRKVVGQIDVGPLPNECECTPDGRFVYVPCDDGHYWVVDSESHQVVTRIKTGGRPHNTVRSPDGRRMYLSPMGDPHRVTIVDVAAGHRVIGEIPFDNATRPTAITNDEKFMFQHIDGLVGFQVADIAQRRVIQTVRDRIPEEWKSKESRGHGLAVRPDQKEVWSCNVEHHLVHVHELTSGDYAEIATIEMPGLVYWVSFTPDSKYAFVSARSVGQVAVVDCQTKKIVTLLAAGREPKRTQVIDVPR